MLLQVAILSHLDLACKLSNQVSSIMIKTIQLYRSLILGAVLVLSAAESAAMFGRGGYGRGYGGYGGGYGDSGLDIYGLDRADKALKDKQAEIQKLQEEQIELAHLEEDIAALRAELRAPRTSQKRVAEIRKMMQRYDVLQAKARGAGGEFYPNEIERLEDLLPELSKQVANLASGRREMNVGQLVAKGIAGEDFYLFDYGKCDSLWDGLKQGLILGTSKEFGEFVRVKMRAVFQDKLGAVFDASINGLSDGFQRIKEILFHDSKRPFNEAEIAAWASHVDSIFDDIKLLSKDGLRDVYRSQDTTMRQAQSDLDDGATVGEDGAAAARPTLKPLRVWADLFGGYVLQLSYYILILQDRKGYYEIDSFEVYFATHLEERLKQFCELLVRINDLADLETYIAVNKAAIPAYKTNITTLFSQLQQQVKPRSFAISAGSQTSVFDRSKTIARSRSRFAADDDEGPQSGYAR